MKEPWRDPWRFTLYRPGHPPYVAECIVLRGEHRGELKLEIHWKGTEHPPDVQALLAQALEQRIAEVLRDVNVIRLPNGA